MAFSSEAFVMGEYNAKEACFGKQLSRPTSENIELITQYINSIRAEGKRNNSILSY